MSIYQRQIEVIEAVVKKLLFTQNRDPYSKTFGCFDRHYWAWKLTDFPEATYQRNVYTLAWFLEHGGPHSIEAKSELEIAIRAGLEFSTSIQHQNGSFDQAFPNENSFGATAFMLHPLLASLEIAEKHFPGDWTLEIGLALRRSADFLARFEETHAFISNHLAAAALSLLYAESRWGEKYGLQSDQFVSAIIHRQSSEGWFLEYDGADPGYQSLCIYYLSQCQIMRPREELALALLSAVEFISWFIHPDGTFGGEYGSRRTSVCYLGGLGLLGVTNPLASAFVYEALAGQAVGKLLTCMEVDMGNLAPLTANHMLLVECIKRLVIPSELPWQRPNAFRYFKDAGIFVRGEGKGYVVIGLSAGGVVKIFDKTNRRLIVDDSGYLGIIKEDNKITTQITQIPIVEIATSENLVFETQFFKLLDDIQTPYRMILLRALNLTLMRNISIGNLIKGLLVRRLISKKQSAGLMLKREIQFKEGEVHFVDRISYSTFPFRLKLLERGRRFVGMHMASSRYFSGFLDSCLSLSYAARRQQLDVNKLSSEGFLENSWAVFYSE